MTGQYTTDIWDERDAERAIERTAAGDRSIFIGGSDVAAILGLSPWPAATPLSTWMRKRGLLPPPREDETRERAMRRGKKLEPYVVDTLVELHGVEVTRRSSEERPNRHVDPEVPFLAAELDFEWVVTDRMAEEHGLDPALVGTVQNGEVKTHHPKAFWRRYGEEGTDEVPIEYACQALHGQGVTGRQLTMVAVMVGSEDPLLYWVKREKALLAEMRGRLVRFWRENVEAGVAPEPINRPDVVLAFRRRAASSIEATPEVAEMVQMLIMARDAKTAAGARAEEIEFQIGAYMLGAPESDRKLPLKPGRHVLHAGGVELLTVQLQGRATIDRKALAREMPEVAKRFERSSSFYVFRPKRGGRT